MKRILSLIASVFLCSEMFAAAGLYVGELTSPESGLSFKTESLVYGKPAEKPFVFGKPYTIDMKFLQDGAADLVLKFSEECFLDNVSVNVGGRFPGAFLQILTPKQPVTAELQLEKGENAVAVGWRSDTFIFRFYKKIGAMKTVRLEVVDKDYFPFTVNNIRLFGATGFEDAVFPIPRKIAFGEGTLAVTGAAAPKKVAFAAENFRLKYEGKCGKALPSKGNVSFALDEKMGKEAFSVSVGSDKATVRGGSLRALLYAGEKMLQLLDSEGNLRCAEIEDSPEFPIRGIHIALTERKNREFLERMVKYVFMPMGYNTVFLQFCGNMEYKKHPEINEAWVRACELYESGNGPKPAHYGFVGRDIVSQQEVRDLCDFLRSYGFDIIPEVQTFGHTQYITMAHPELAEKVEVKARAHNQLVEDARPDVTYYHSCCPNAEGYFPMVFDIIDEVVSVVRPDGYVHIGHDEIYELGMCPKCKAEGAANVYAREVTTLHDYLAKKGLGTMMWSDMITRTNYASSASIGRLPKDIVCLPFTWYFYLRENTDTELPLVENGYRYLIGNLYSSHFPRFDVRKKNPGMLGGEVSTWQVCDENHYGYQGKIYDFVYTANLLWSAGDYDGYRRSMNEIVRSRLPELRGMIHYGTLPEDVPGTEVVLEGNDVPFDMTNNFRSAIAASKGADAVVRIGMKAEKIVVANATDIPGEEGVTQRGFPDPFARYIIEYEDGSSWEEPIVYGYQMGAYRWPWGAPRLSPNFRHFGYPFTYPSVPTSLKTCSGEDATVWNYTIDNPSPEKPVKNLRVSTDGAGGAEIIIFGVTVK